MNVWRRIPVNPEPPGLRRGLKSFVILLGTAAYLGLLASCGLWPSKADYETVQYEEGGLQGRDGSPEDAGGSSLDGGVLALRPEISGSVLGEISGLSPNGPDGAPGFAGEGAAEWTLPPGSTPIDLGRSFEPILFDYNSSRIDFPARRMLRDVARWLDEHPAAHITLEGHCDPKGSSEYNFNLGHSRASSARQALANLEIEPTRLHTISYGEERPRVLGDAPESDRLNRRVEFRLHSRPRPAADDRPDQAAKRPPEIRPTPDAAGVEVVPDSPAESAD